jgi:hypothetical protein
VKVDFFKFEDPAVETKDLFDIIRIDLFFYLDPISVTTHFGTKGFKYL